MKHNLDKYKQTLLNLITFFLMGCFCCSVVSAGSQKISIEFEDQKIQQVLKQISAVTGYKIELFSRELLDSKISGSFYNLSLLELLNRILTNENKAISINDDQKKIAVFIYRSAQAALTPPYAAENPDTAYEELPESNQVPFEGIDMDNLEVIPADNPDEPGMTHAEFQKLEALQNKNIDKLSLEVIPSDDPEQDGITLGEYLEIEKQLTYTNDIHFFKEQQ